MVTKRKPKPSTTCTCARQQDPWFGPGHHVDCPDYVPPGCHVQPLSSRVCEKGRNGCVVPHGLDDPEPMPELPGLPVAKSSFQIRGGQVDETTWTSENQIVRYLRPNASEADAMRARRLLRYAAKNGMLPARRHPEHGYWEYGSQWRQPEFKSMINAVDAALRLGGS